MNRRGFLLQSTAAAAVLPGAWPLRLPPPAATAERDPPSGARPGNPIAVSTYSFWHFDDKKIVKIEDCIRMAARDGLRRRRNPRSPDAQQGATPTSVAQAAGLLAGLDLCGLSTHQTFLSPKPEVRKKNIDITIASIELAYALGIPTMRINTGRWGTSKDFDELMKHRGIEPPLPGYTDEDGFPWVIDCIEKCLPAAEKCGVVLGLENHWGLARTPEGLLRIVNAIHSPWLGVTLDMGNFLEDPYDEARSRSRRRRPTSTPRPIMAAACGIRSIWITTASPPSSARSTTAAASRWNTKARKSEDGRAKSLALLRKAFRRVTTTNVIERYVRPALRLWKVRSRRQPL